ncbi:MAG: molybdopterin converting factor subunit 1 [Planctomycetes bacterium]|nr:molybdopterin converting factor subunit 1 [Planctomycetota bacterium]
MQCQVLLFAQLAQTIGKDRITIELSNGATVNEALNELAQEHKTIAQMRNSIAVAINEQYCNTNTEIKDGDTLALIPPVSGG